MASMNLIWFLHDFHMKRKSHENNMRHFSLCDAGIITQSYVSIENIKSFLSWAQYSMVKSLPPWFVQCQTVCVSTLKGNQSNSGAMIWWNMVMKSVTNKMVSYVYYCIFNCKDKDVSTFLGFAKVILYFFH